MNVKQPFSTDDNVDHPVSLYAATKRSNELMAYTYSHLYEIPSTGLRFFTVYGPYGRPDMAYFKFTSAILRGETIDVFNNGEMLRDFTYIDDIVKGVLRVVDNPPHNQLNTYSDAMARHKVLNIGNNSPVTLKHFIRVIEEITGKKAFKNLMPMQPGDVPATFANIDPLIKDYVFRPKTPIEEGIRKFILWFLEMERSKG
jgi:UDP-glucuronate 4-epimerase